jgi:D-serine deaminase-like pyridoxal phosphate-dependent protein
MFHGLRKRPTYNSLVGYLDGGQEYIQYPDRLASQLQNSYELNDLLDDEGKGWFQENKEQMRNFAEQQVNDILMKANLERGQALQQQEEDKRRQWQIDKDEEIAQMRERQEMSKEDGIVDMFKKCKIKGSRGRGSLTRSRSNLRRKKST